MDLISDCFRHQITGNQLELLQGRLQNVHDLLRNFVGRLQQRQRQAAVLLE